MCQDNVGLATHMSEIEEARVRNYEDLRYPTLTHPTLNPARVTYPNPSF